MGDDRNGARAHRWSQRDRYEEKPREVRDLRRSQPRSELVAVVHRHGDRARLGNRTRLIGDVEDQSALHGVLAQVRDLGLEVISVVRVDHNHEETS